MTARDLHPTHGEDGLDPRVDALSALLERHRSDLLRAVDAVPEASRDSSPSPGSWSVAQVLEHLATTERAITRLFTGWLAESAPRADGEAFDEAAFAREIDMPVFLDRSRRIEGRQPPGELNAAAAKLALADGREDLLRAIAQARGRRLEDSSRAHPATGLPLNAYQWIAFLALHEGRHAAQVAEIASALGPRPVR